MIPLFFIASGFSGNGSGSSNQNGNVGFDLLGDPYSALEPRR